MTNLLFLAAIALFIFILFNWSFRSLQKEKWQILGTIPRHKDADGHWHGTNLTYYGFFTAVAATFGCCIGLILYGTQRVELITMLMICLAIFIPSGISAKVSARIVEKKEATISIGGAAFFAIVMAPWLFVFLRKYFGLELQIVTGLSVIAISYTFGESLGRLACVSFGCCYGKRISEVPGWMGRLFKHFSFVFDGDLKKISYAHHMDGEAVIPIQAVTSIIYAITGMIGLYLFMLGYHTPAFLLTIIVTQSWRLISEFVRADYRGDSKISAYQIMGAFSVIYVIAIVLIFPIQGIPAGEITDGLVLLWNPGVIIFLEFIFILSFVYTGRSQVIGAKLMFNVETHKI